MKFAALLLIALALALSACNSNPYKGQTGKNGMPAIWEYGPIKPQSAPKS